MKDLKLKAAGLCAKKNTGHETSRHVTGKREFKKALEEQRATSEIFNLIAYEGKHMTTLAFEKRWNPAPRLGLEPLAFVSYRRADAHDLANPIANALPERLKGDLRR